MKNNHRWNPKGYHKNSIVQLNASLHLLNNIILDGSESILDVGSGDGKISAQLAQKVPRGLVTGIDNSPEMINFSQSTFSKKDYPNLSFILKDAQEPTFSNNFDLVFSSFCLQWVLNLDLFLSHIDQILLPNGHFVATIPAGIPEAMEIALQEVMNAPKWKKYFYNFHKTWVFRDEKEFLQVLYSYKFQIQLLNTVFQEEIFLTEGDLKDYLKYSFPHVCYLPIQMQSFFIREVINKYLEIESPQKKGAILFIFPRLDIIANKN